ncbi:MAG: phosphatase PAP2 family protein [Chitinophagaceae bacterium]|nr:phosphatase PAP2 family protein [Chitinophagaceae bacterium]MCW5904482.1 phosphatase PAP2 family protein [Chitinophagaceae bacterium]
MLQKQDYSNFWLGCIITFITSVILFFLNYTLGKHPFFLLLNNDLGIGADYFFKFYTNVGDGIIWAILLLIFLKYKKQYIPLLISSFIISTILVQICKYLILPNEPRPIAAIEETALIHTVLGLEPHRISTFPSGHSASAFCFFLIACIVITKKWIVPVGFIGALLVGYSRVYLAQHFPFDVAAGMITAIISVMASLAVQQWWTKKKKVT